MKKLLKGVFLILCVLVFVIVMSIAGFMWIFDWNDYKSDLAAFVTRRAGRNLNIIGAIELSVLPALKVTIGKSVLSNPSGFSDSVFAEFQEAAVKVKLKPLLSGKIEIKSVSIIALQLHLSKNRQGQTNWDDLLQTKAAPDVNRSKQNLQTLLALPVLDELKLERSQLRWEDQMSGRHLELTDLNFSVDGLRLGHSTPLSLAFSVSQKGLDLTPDIRFSTELFVDDTLDAFKLMHTRLAMQDVIQSAPELNLNVNTIEYFHSGRSVNVTGARLQSEAFTLETDLSGKYAKDAFILQGPVRVAKFNPKQLLQQWHVALPVMQDKTALTSASANLELEVTQDSAQFKALKLALDQTAIQGSGVLSYVAKPLLKFAITADAIDVDRYLSPKENGADLMPISPSAIAAQAGALWTNLERFQSIHADGQLTIRQLTVNQTTMQGITFALRDQSVRP